MVGSGYVTKQLERWAAPCQLRHGLVIICTTGFSGHPPMPARVRLRLRGVVGALMGQRSPIVKFAPSQSCCAVQSKGSERHRDAVHAITQAGWLWAVVEHVA